VGTWDDTDGLVSIGRFARGNTAEALKLERLQNAWPLMVAKGLSRDTHPISISNGMLLIGCHNTFALKSMRSCADSTWPDLRRRIDAAIGTHLQRIEITPSDPPQTAPTHISHGKPQQEKSAKTKDTKGKGGNTRDPLEAILKFYAASRGGGNRS